MQPLSTTAKRRFLGKAKRKEPDRKEAGIVSSSRFRKILSNIRRIPNVRKNKIERIKKAILEDSYESEEKLLKAVSRLIEENR